MSSYVKVKNKKHLYNYKEFTSHASLNTEEDFMSIVQMDKSISQ